MNELGEREGDLLSFLYACLATSDCLNKSQDLWPMAYIDI